MKTLVVLGLTLLTGMAIGFSQDLSGRTYTLLSGSQLTDDCPVCDRPVVVQPMTGSFVLRLLDETPLFTRYVLTNIDFQAGAAPGLHYTVTGSGVYQVGGEVAVIQDIFLELDINNGASITEARCQNEDRRVNSAWPNIQINLRQTNGTLTQVYYLELVAAPALQFTSVTFDSETGDVRLEWDGAGSKVQVERTSALDSPFSPVSHVTNEHSFIDVGAARMHQHLFYRLRRM